MFIRIMQLGIALYYGEIGNFKDGETEDSTVTIKICWEMLQVNTTKFLPSLFLQVFFTL